MKKYYLNKEESSHYIKYYVECGSNRNIIYYGNGTKKISYLSKDKLNNIMESQVRKNEFNVLGDNEKTIVGKLNKKMELMLILVISGIPLIIINAIPILIIYSLVLSDLGISSFHDMKIISDYKKNVFYLDNKKCLNKTAENININKINNMRINELIQLNSLFNNNCSEPKKLILKRRKK